MLHHEHDLSQTANTAAADINQTSDAIMNQPYATLNIISALLYNDKHLFKYQEYV